MATYPTTGVESVGAFVPMAQGRDNVFVYEETFDLSELIPVVIANADIINLITLPASYAILATSLETVTAGTDDATTFTLQLRYTTTAIGPAVSCVAEGIGLGGATTYSLPAVPGAAVAINLVAVVSGGNAVALTNPVVKVKMLVCDMS